MCRCAVENDGSFCFPSIRRNGVGSIRRQSRRGSGAGRPGGMSLLQSCVQFRGGDFEVREFVLERGIVLVLCPRAAIVTHIHLMQHIV